MDDTYEKQVAVTIFEQLGGVGFATMIGLITPIFVRVEAPGEITAIFRWKAKSKGALECPPLSGQFKQPSCSRTG